VGKYRILIKPSAVREIEGVPKRHRLRIVRKIQALSQNPRPPGCEKLSAEEKYRVRQGWYRIAYSIDDKEQTVLVVKVGHRRQVYR
jgi:mRNA interferase RelE/StbE